MSKPRQACVDCHFFLSERRVSDPHADEVSEELRKKCREDDFSWHGDGYSLMCSFLVWDEGYKVKDGQFYELIVETERKDACFFWPWHPGMLIPAARVLQSRERAQADADRGLRLTRRSLYVAVGALAVNTVAIVAKAIPSSWWHAVWSVLR